MCRTKPLSDDYSHPISHIYNSDVNESKPHVTFAAEGHKSVIDNQRQLRPDRSASRLDRSSHIVMNGTERSGGINVIIGNGKWPLKSDGRQARPTLPPGDWKTRRRPPYHPRSYSPSRPYLDSLYDAWKNEIRGLRPNSVYNDGFLCEWDQQKEIPGAISPIKMNHSLVPYLHIHLWMGSVKLNQPILPGTVLDDRPTVARASFK